MESENEPRVIDVVIEMSPTCGKLFEAMACAQGETPQAELNKRNPHFKSDYADLGSIIRAIKASLSKHGIAYIQAPTSNGMDVTVVTVIGHKSGEWIKSTCRLRASKQDAQGVGAAFTYGKRYGLGAAVGISTDDDDDGNGAVAGGPPQREVGPKLEPKPEPSAPDPKRAFADSIREWSGVNAENLKAACGDTFKKLGVDPKTVADWPALNQRLADAREVFGTFGEWIASKE